MPSSTSSSDIYLTRRDVPGGAWLRPFAVGFLVFCLAVSMLEGVLAMRGFKPTVVDSPERWSHERERASELGHEGIILIGASRAQLDVDLPTLASESGRPVMQLAIDGNSYVPVLRDLAEDDRVTGTIVVEYQDGAMRGAFPEDRATEYVENARRTRQRHTHIDFSASESALGDVRQSVMRSYADGAGPWAALQRRVMVPTAMPQYLVTLPSRQREANYSLVPMPDFYFQRVMRNAGIRTTPVASSPKVLNDELEAQISELHGLDAPEFSEHATNVAAMVRRIEARGGTVIFVMFPRSGLVWAADDRRFPRSLYWDRFMTLTGAHGLHFKDVPALNAFWCPDGSHLDVRDQVKFTHALADTMAARGWITRTR